MRVHVYKDAKQIASCVEKLGSKIYEDFKTEKLTVISVLKGAFVFTADLIRHIPLENRIRFYSGI